MWRAFLLAVLIVPTSAFSQDRSAWIGKRVITHYGAVLQMGNQVVDDVKRGITFSFSGKDRNNFRVCRVDYVNGNWLWLKVEKEGIEGWVNAEYVIPYDQAIDYFTNQIRANPSQWPWYNHRGLVWKEKGEYDIAIADFNEVIRLYPSSEAAFNNRGNAWHDKKEYDKAIADYNKSIQLDPKFAMAFNNRGNAWGNKKEYDKAIADYNESVQLDPRFAMAFNNRGNAWGKKKEYDKAIAGYNEAIRLDPKFALAFYNRGNAWSRKKDYDKAIADFNEAVRLDPKNANAYNSRAWLWATCVDGKFRDGMKAVESATCASELTEWNRNYDVGTLAAAYAEAGDFEKAVELQEKANKLYADVEAKKGEERLKLYKEKKPYRESA